MLYVEDDERLARATMEFLTARGVEVQLVPSADIAIAEVNQIRPDVVVLDVANGGDSADTLRQLRARTSVPILLISAEPALGLADDHLARPFAPDELLARIRSHAPPQRRPHGPAAARIEVGELVIDGAPEIMVRGKRVTLSATEHALLHALARQVGRVLGREQLLELVHGSAEEAFDRSIDVIVSRLRAKIEIDPRNPQLLKTVRGSGYMLSAPGS